MSQKKENPEQDKKDVKVQDLAPKKDAKGGRASMGGANRDASGSGGGSLSGSNRNTQGTSGGSGLA